MAERTPEGDRGRDAETEAAGRLKTMDVHIDLDDGSRVRGAVAGRQTRADAPIHSEHVDCGTNLDLSERAELTREERVRAAAEWFAENDYKIVTIGGKREKIYFSPLPRN